RALVGLAATLSSLGRVQDADWCWRVIANQANGFVTEPERTRWQFRALAWSKRTQASLQLAQDQLQVGNGLANREFWTLCLEHAAYLRPTGDQLATELLAIGAIGFVRTGSLQPLADVLLRLEIEWNDHPWVDHWLQGVQAWRQADLAETSDEHATAALRSQHHLNEVIRQSLADCGPLPLASAAYLLAHFSYDASDWKQAVEWAEQALALSRDADAAVLQLAAAWLNAQSQVQLARQDRSRLPTAWAALDALQAEFPQSIEAQRAALIRIKLENTWLTPGEALNNLSGLPDSPWLKGEVAFERLLQLHRGWASELQRNPDGSQPLRRLLLDEWRGWHALPQNSNESRGAARLLVVDALLRGTDSTAEDVQQAEQLLAEHASLERTLSPRSPLFEEGRFQRMLLAQRKQDENQLIAQAEWLAKNARAVASRRAALVVLSQHWEAVWESGQRQDLEVTQSLHRCLTELVELGQQSGGTAWLNDGAMRYAVRRLAECDTLLGRMQQADQWYDQLLSSGKPDREALTASGRIKMKLAQWSAAAARWRELGDGVAPGSETWLESRWQLAQCLAHLEPATAMAICDQTLLLYPDMPEVWRQRLQSVGGR
ncbi:MAG TPA: hypothetical protein PKD54_02985, partial [Pirellulaceae bacterium]|nr:hypothetical protein [Pirellulaceae bacterium]